MKRNNFLKKIKGLKSILKIRESGIFIGLLVLFLVITVMTPEYFLTLGNLMKILRQISYVGIVAIGMATVIVSGEFDLSVGSTYGMAVMLGGVLIKNGIDVWLALMIALLSGILVGLINGVLVTYGKIPSFIVTLGMLSIIRGFNLTITGGYTIEIADQYTTLIGILRFLALGRLFGFIPVIGVIFIGVALIGGIIFHKTIFGLHMRTVGSDPFSARLSGIDVKRIKILSFIICGFLATFAGTINLFFFDYAKGTIGYGLELLVITATIIGGVSLMGGKGSILGVIIGVLIIGVIKNGLTLMTTSAFWQPLILGFVIIIAVAIDLWVRKEKIPRIW